MSYMISLYIHTTFLLRISYDMVQYPIIITTYNMMIDIFHTRVYVSMHATYRGISNNNSKKLTCLGTQSI